MNHNVYVYQDLLEKINSIITETHVLTKDQIKCILELSDYVVQIENDLEDLEWDYEELTKELKELKQCLKDTT